MKKLFSLLLVCALILCAAACAETVVGMPNPVMEVLDDDAFETVLGIELDSEDLPGEDLRLSIIDGTVGQAVFTLTNVENEPVEWTLRFTKDASFDSSVELFAGIYDEDLTEPITETIPFTDDDDPAVDVDIAYVRANTEGVDIFFWQFKGTYFSLTVNGTYSQMQMAEAADRISEACMD